MIETIRNYRENTDLEFISLFSGAGGLDIGLEQAGFKCLFATDHDPLAVATLRRNQGKRISRGMRAMDAAIIAQEDVRSLSGKSILKAIGRRKGQIPLLAGGPPCQSWSSAGLQKGFDDPRGRLFEDYIRIATDLEVPWLLFENVRGLLTARGSDGVPGSALASMRERLLAKGWQTKVELLNAADYGVPQRRVRLFLLGYRTGKAPSWPLPTHLQQPDLTSKKSWVSLGSAVGSLDISDDELIRPTGKLAIELADLPAGTGVKSAGKKETTRPGGHWGYRQGSFIADLSLPARTVTANSQQDWIRDPKLGLRKLCPRECAAVQAFPGNWEFSGERADQYRLIGNAVPPQLARALGNGLADFIKSMPIVRRRFSEQELEPLPSRLDLAIRYTKREELRNGESRRASARTPQMIKRQRIA